MSAAESQSLPSDGSIRRASRLDAAAIEALRLACYRRAREFVLLQPDCLAWDDFDDAGVVYKLCDAQGAILATVRSSWVPSADALERRMGCECRLAPSCFPTLFLSRGATVAASGGAGLHSLMRFHYLAAAARLGAASATGAVYEHAPRVRSMGLLGYRFERPSRVWDPEVRAVQPMLVACLPAAGIPAALRLLTELVGDAMERFPIDFDVEAAHGPCAATMAAGVTP